MSSKPLTKRQRQVLILLVHGAGVHDTAKALGIAVRTVNAHRYNIRVRLDLWAQADLIRWAVENGLAELRRRGANGGGTV